MNRIEFARFPALDYACAEAFNALCTNLSFAGSGTRVVMVTSTQAHEGKSFLSMNLMRTLARLGKRVAMVDCDLRRSQLAAKYGLRVREGTGCGVAHYLAGMCAAEEILYATNLPGAHMVPVGREVSNSLALLSAPRLGELLGMLSERFDQVIVDAPPVGVIIDAAEIAKSCDGTIFAVKYNATGRRDLLEARRQIERTGCPVLGAVLNAVDLDALSSKRYYNRSYCARYNSDYGDAPGGRCPRGGRR